jgi:hypothetical protein
MRTTQDPQQTRKDLPIHEQETSESDAATEGGRTTRW